jgi:hypothetical protein
MEQAQAVVELQQLAQTQHHQTQAALVVMAHQIILHGDQQLPQVKTLAAHIGTQAAAVERVVTQASKAQQVMAAGVLEDTEPLMQPQVQLIRVELEAGVRSTLARVELEDRESSLSVTQRHRWTNGTLGGIRR